MSLRFHWKVVMVLFVSLIFLSLEGVLALYPGYESVVIVPFGEVDVELYVVALNGVDGFGNMTRTVEGFLSACPHDENRVTFLVDWPILGEVKVNADVSVIRNWDEYRNVVETGSNIIIANAHGETLPVPAGYTRDGWVDKIADAMAYRNVTWVHTGGYPFFYVHEQDGGMSEWREKGFQALMGHIGKSNVTCFPEGSETLKVLMNEAAEYTLVYGWHMVIMAGKVETWRPLSGSDFKDCSLSPIWGDVEYFMPGAIVKFAKANQTNSFGFYVHIGTRKTFTRDLGETDGDYYRGYVGAAQAIYTVAFRTLSSKAISEAEIAILLAESEGRTKGLSEARGLLFQAKEYYFHNPRLAYSEALIYAKHAVEAANNAVKPSFVEAYASHLVLAIISVVVIATGVGVRWKRNSKRVVKQNE